MSQETKTITVSEFRFWLQGVEEMQSEDWTPDPRQWKRIREKIDQISDTQPNYIAPVTQNNSVLYRAPAFDTPAQIAPGGLSEVQPMPVVIQPPVNSHLFANADASNIAVKTPNIDTSKGSYESSFA